MTTVRVYTKRLDVPFVEYSDIGLNISEDYDGGLRINNAEYNENLTLKAKPTIEAYFRPETWNSYSITRERSEVG